MDLQGVSAIVTGGASGLGAATARQLAKRGAHVVVADIAEDKGKEVIRVDGGARLQPK
jgi:NAD(P)-dependent dehydrogenase (short-subunit alcohol dehydrogenase family)